MKILLDTHVFLWALLEPEQLSAGAVATLQSTENTIFFSAASSWEIAIKWSKGGIILPKPPQDFVIGRLIETGTLILPISIGETLLVADLPYHHRDPFDRLLIAQAKSQGLRIFSTDPVFKKYDVDVFWL